MSEDFVASTPEAIRQVHSALVADALTDIQTVRAEHLAIDWLRRVKVFRQVSEAVFGPIVRAARAALDTALAQRRAVEEPVFEAEARVRQALGAWEARRREVEPEIPSIPLVDGIHYSTIWTAEVTSMQSLVEAVATGKAPLRVLRADQTQLNNLARSLRESMDIPGVIARQQPRVTVRTPLP